MRYLVLSDIHANRVALEAVLSHAKRQRYDQVIFLGDAVGYYTEPVATLELLRDLEPVVALIGNHDALLLEHKGGNTAASAGEGIVGSIIARHAQEVNSDNLRFVRQLMKYEQRDLWEATHGALHEPWAYLSSLPQAQLSMPLMQTNLCMVGHTHIPVVYAQVHSGAKDMWRTVHFRADRNLYRIPPKVKIIFNPGSVGQPRDGIPKSSYAIFDEEARTLEVLRVEFNIRKVQQLVRDAGYSEALARRLERGV